MSRLADLYVDLDRRLELRERYYPARREPEWSTLQECLVAVTAELWANASTEPARGPTTDVERLAEAPVFVLGYYKSGTSLLLNLLDGHPDLVVLPGESRHFTSFVPGAAHLDTESRLQDLHARWIRNMITPYGILPRWLLGKPVDGKRDRYDGFGRDLVAFARQRGDRDLLAAAAQAVATAAGGSGRYWAEKTPTHEFHVDEILAAYPAARFIHVLRDPHTTVDSILRYGVEAPIVDGLTAAAELSRSFGAALSWQRKLGARYTVIRYETLVADTEATMRTIAGALDIAYDERLLVPTTLGMPATANAGRPERRVSGAVHTLSLRERPDLGRRDRLAVDALAGRAAHALGYPEVRRSGAAALAARAALFVRYRLRRT